MGAFLLAAGEKGKRFALPNSEVMIHQPLGGTRGQASDIGNEELIIITPDGNSVFQSSAIIEERDEQQWIEAVSRSGQESGVIEWQETKEPFVLIYDTIADSRGGWKLIKIIPESSLFESAYDVAYINILFGILGLSLVILATFFINSGIWD